MEINLSFILNDKPVKVKVNPAMVLLDFIRKQKRLSGTKEVCKEGDCGACVVLLGESFNGNIRYKTINSCIFPIKKVSGKHIVTIEGLNQTELTPIQKAFLNEGASQCGFCTPGFIVSFTGYLLNTKFFNQEDAINAIAGNICRCTGYHSIIRAIKNTLKQNTEINFSYLIENNFIPPYFKSIPQMLKSISIETKEAKRKNVKIISGGTDLFVQQPDNLIYSDIEIIENIIKPKIEIDKNQIRISGSSTVENLKNFLLTNNTNLNLSKLFQLFASMPIRNSATIAGNIVNASPIADITITLLALNAKIELTDQNNSHRNIFLKDLYKGYKTLDKNEDEIIESIYFDIPNNNSYFNFEKVSKRKYLDIASVNSAILIEFENNKIKSASVAVGGVAPIPLYLKDTSNFLCDKTLNKKSILSALEIAGSEISPISDIRGSAEYKRLLTQQLIKAHFIELFPNVISAEVIL